MTDGKSVRLFLVDGTSGGLLTAEIMNWTGYVVAAPRSDLATLLRRPEVSRTGIYVLLGDDPKSLGGQSAYIGEGDDVGKRLYEHSRPEDKGGKGGKDFWDRAVVVTSKDTNLTKAHARYLESRLIALAADAKRARLMNSTNPPVINLPEADVSDMEYFISQVKIVLPVLGVNIFRATAKTAAMSNDDQRSTDGSESPVFEFKLAKAGIKAVAEEVDGEFVVKAQSVARRVWQGVDDGYKRLRESLEQDGTLVDSDDGKAKVFTHDQVFRSPSAAAAVIAGRSANGRVEWKVRGTRRTYAEWQSALLEAVAPEVIDE